MPHLTAAMILTRPAAATGTPAGAQKPPEATKPPPEADVGKIVTDFRQPFEIYSSGPLDPALIP